MKKNTLYIIFVLIFSLLFLSCQGITPDITPTPIPTPSEGEGEVESTGRVVMVELFNIEGCPACKAINPVIEDLIKNEYSTDEVILVELKGWLDGATPETQERFGWYVEGTKHTPFIAFNGLSDTFSEGVSGGGGGGGGGGTVTHPSIKEFYGIAYTGYSPLISYGISEIKGGVLPKMSNITGKNITNLLSRGSEYNAIYLIWEGYSGCEGFRIYRSENSEDVNEYEKFVELELQPGYIPEGIFCYEDKNYEQGNTYRYYVTAYNNTKKWETPRSDIFIITIDSYTFLPPIILQKPEADENINNPGYLFQWLHSNIALPFGDVSSGDTIIYVIDKNDSYNSMMEKEFDGLDVYKANYDGYPLIPGRTYSWNAGCLGYNASGQIVSLSLGEERDFIYSEPLGGVFYFNAIAITEQAPDKKGKEIQDKVEYLKNEGRIQDGFQFSKLSNISKDVIQHSIELSWYSPAATYSELYRSVSGSGSILYQGTIYPDNDGWYNFSDGNISIENSYTYYVKVYGDGWEKESQEVIIDTWLPPCSLSSPADEAIVDEVIPTFAWNPVGSNIPQSIYYVKSDMWVYDLTAGAPAWRVWFDDVSTNSETYNSDGRAASLVDGHDYYWNSWAYGENENGKVIAISCSEDWNFTVEVEGSTVLRRALSRGRRLYVQ